MIFDDSIGRGDEFEELVPIRRVLEIQRQAALIGVQKVKGSAGFWIGVILREGPPGPASVARRRFDLDDVGSVVGKEFRAISS